MRTLHHQYLQLHQHRITSSTRRAPHPPPLRLVLPRPPMVIITMAGTPHICTSLTVPVAIILPVTFLHNTIPTGLPITPFSRAFIAFFSYKSRVHPLFCIFRPPRSVSQMTQVLASSTAAPRPFVCEECGMNFSRQHGSFFLFSFFLFLFFGLSGFTHSFKAII